MRTGYRCAIGGLLLCALAGCAGDSGGLSREQEQAVESVTRLTKYFGSVVGSFADLAKLKNLVPTLAGMAFGETPRVTARLKGLGLEVGFDYGAGRALPLAGGKTVAGRVDIGFDLTRVEGRLGFQQFSLAGHPVDGAIGVYPRERRLDDLRLRVDTLRIDRIGTLEGETGVLIVTDGTVGMRDGRLTMRDIAGGEFGVTVADLAVNPFRNGNAMPQRGEVIFAMPLKVLGIQKVDLKVRFNDQSPRDGTVDVFVGPLGPIRYKVLHLAE